MQSGDIVKGGAQDRMLVTDLILPPRSGKIAIGAFCVENGRWSKRGNEEVTQFTSSANVVASREVKLAAKEKGSQSEEWAEVAAAQDKLSRNVGGSVKSATSPTSFQLALENKQVTTSADSYVKALSAIADSKTDVIGYVFAINGKINSADIYASNTLFKKLWPKLLQASAIEAWLNYDAAKVRRAEAGDVQGFIDEAIRSRAGKMFPDVCRW